MQCIGSLAIEKVQRFVDTQSWMKTYLHESYQVYFFFSASTTDA